jgi:mRNA interferase RelE/StbE
LTGDRWSYIATPPARRDLRRLDPPVKRRIVDALDRFIVDPHAADIRKLSGSGEWRLRVGEWRVRFEFDDEALLVIVTRVLPRGRAYNR